MGLIPALITTNPVNIFIVSGQTPNYGDFNNFVGNSITGG
jgi:hypothetical protein